MDFDQLFKFFTDSLHTIEFGPTDFDLAMANSTIWGCALDEALAEKIGAPYKAARDADPNGRVLDGLRLARNAILHGQTLILGDGRAYPETGFVLFYGPPKWKSYEELTAEWKPRYEKTAGHLRLRDTYEREVAGSNIGDPLWSARNWLEALSGRRWAVQA